MRFSLLVVPALLTAGLTAQTEEVEVQALGNVSVIAKSGNQTQFGTIAPGTKVTADFTAQHSLQLRAIANANTGGGWASIGSSGSVWRSDIINARFLPVLTATFLQSGSVSGNGTTALSSSSSSTNPQPGPQSFLVTFRGPKSIRGNVRLSWEGRTQTATSKTGATIDVGNDNTIDFVGDAAKSNREERFFPVSFANGPVVVKVTFTGSGSTPGKSVQAHWQRVKLNMIKTGTCGIASFGQSCGGAKLDGGMLVLGSTAIVSLKLTGGAANGFFVRVAGTQRVNATLPGGCTLLASPEIVVLGRANASGEFSEAFTLSADTNWKVVFQYIPFDLVSGQLQLKATNGQEASCSGF